MRWSVHVREENGGGHEVRGRFVFATTRLDTNRLEAMIGWVKRSGKMMTSAWPGRIRSQDWTEAVTHFETNAATTDHTRTSKHMPPRAERTRADDQGLDKPAGLLITCAAWWRRCRCSRSSKNSTCPATTCKIKVLRSSPSS